MKRILALLCTLVAVSAFAYTAEAELFEFSQEFPSGFEVSINGGGPTASGPISVVGLVDDSSVDQSGDINQGEFTLFNVRLSGAGFVNEPVVTPLNLLTFSDGRNFAFQVAGLFNQGIVGWNGASNSGNFMTDVNDLNSLVSLPYTTTGTSSFWLDLSGNVAIGLGTFGNAWLLESGDTIGGDIGANGPDGTFGIRAVPEPSNAVLVLTGLCGFVVRRRRR